MLMNVGGFEACGGLVQSGFLHCAETERSQKPFVLRSRGLQIGALALAIVGFYQVGSAPETWWRGTGDTPKLHIKQLWEDKRL